ncbi:unnamed protein product [Leptidea sinapis]|uniref:BEACH domain-containing protein n=1 Tax=Leptidea sinapis TaxID=189913 RepID=A0A5E4R2A6_9NEOP|nr:unnamed protein product [Leptidea sinapis]
MDFIVKELGINRKNIHSTHTPSLFGVVVHNTWLKKWIKNLDVDNTVNNLDYTLQPGESVPYPWHKVFIKVLKKKISKVLPLPRFKLHEGNTEPSLTFSQILQYVSQNNQRNLWKESFKKYSQNVDNKETSVVNLLDHDHLLSEVLIRLYGCNIIKLTDGSDNSEYKEINKNITKSNDTHSNLLSVLFALETDNNYYIVYRSHYNNSLLDCLNFSPSLIDKTYARGLFIIFQLLNVSKAMLDRGLCLGVLNLEDIFLTEDLWLQIVPPVLNNVHSLDSSLISEQNRSKQMTGQSQIVKSQNDEEWCWRNNVIELEKLCMLWVRGRISNLDYLLQLNILAGRSANDAQAHFMVPWVTDFYSRCGRNWRDLTKSKYRLNKGDRQLDMTYDVTSCNGQIPHHVTDALTDITCYEWTPDECIPEFYTDPTVFKSIHEDLPDLGIPSWASCAEDFITKHREALESAHTDTRAHAKAVPCNCSQRPIRREGLGLPPPHRRGCDGPSLEMLVRKYARESSDDISDEEEESTSLPQHVSRLTVPTQHMRRQKSSSRARSLTKPHDNDASCREARSSSHSRHLRCQKSEMGQGVIYLPKEFNPAASIQTIEALDSFRTKCFFSKSDDSLEEVSTLNLCQMPNSSKVSSDSTAFTNHMFQASYDQGYLKKITQDTQLESVMKEKKNRMFNVRYTTDAAVYKQFVTESRKRDMLVIGCLVVEIFLHNFMRPLRLNSDFAERLKCCRTVLKYNFHSIPKCVNYIASLLLDVRAPSISFKQDLLNDEPVKKVVVTNKGLPPPTSSQLLQPLLMQHLIPFPQSFPVLHSLLSTLHEYEVTNNELNILYTYECDGVHCENYQNVDKTKLYFAQKIAEGKIQACITHLGVLLNQFTGSNQFDVLDIFLQHYIQLLENKETSVLAAWHLFDTVSKALGPAETRNKLLKYILNLYEDDDFVFDKSEKFTETDATASAILASKQKFIKLYHNIFLLQLMVRLGLQCFLDNFTQHLVEAVGGYKDVSYQSGSVGHSCHSRSMANKKPRFSDENVKNVLIVNSDIFSPDTSCGSEQIITPSIERTISEVSEALKDKDIDNRSENELFHFEHEKEVNPSCSSRSKSPTGSIDSSTIKDNLLQSPDHISPGNSRFFITREDSNDNTSNASNNVTYLNVEKPRRLINYLVSDNGDRTELISHSEDEESKDRVVPTLSLTDDKDSYKISDMSSESLIWLAHRLGPVLTCRYITRNLLKMLTLCYIGKENLVSCEMEEVDEFDDISLVNSKVVGDKNAAKVIKCLTSIVAMYGEQLIIFQYLPHMGELIASCRRRLSTPLEGGVVACLQLDTFLKTILQPALRLASTSRSSYPSGAPARCALARKLLDALYALALRIGPEMTRKHLSYNAYTHFVKFVGAETIERSLKNADTIRALCHEYTQKHSPSSPRPIYEDRGETINKNIDSKSGTEHNTSNSFGSNVTLVGNRIDVTSACESPKTFTRRLVDILGARNWTFGQGSKVQFKTNQTADVLWSHAHGEVHTLGSTEPVHCLSVYNNELISGTTNNRIGVHTSLDQDASFSSTKLRSDTFKGVLTCMSVLPLNRLLLLGSDNGTLSLLC